MVSLLSIVPPNGLLGVSHYSLTPYELPQGRRMDLLRVLLSMVPTSQLPATARSRAQDHNREHQSRGNRPSKPRTEITKFC